MFEALVRGLILRESEVVIVLLKQSDTVFLLCHSLKGEKEIQKQ